MPTALPERSPLSALVAEQHARDRLIEAMKVGEAMPLRRFIVADWRCWRAVCRLRRSLRAPRAMRR